MFLFTIICKMCPPTLRRSSARFWDYTGAPATNNVESADVYTQHQLWCEYWDVSLKVTPGCVHSSIWWMPAGLSEGCMLDLKVPTASLLASELFWHHPCYGLLFSLCAAGSDVETVTEYQRHVLMHVANASLGSHLNIYSIYRHNLTADGSDHNYNTITK